MPARAPTPLPTAAAAPEKVRRLGFTGDDVALVAALQRGEPGAPAALYDRHAPYLRRVLARVLGADDELGDVLQETFAQILGSIDKLDDPRRLKGWLVRVAVFTARGVIRKRKRKRWLRFAPPEQLADRRSTTQDPRAREALAAVYAVLDAMPERERVPFTLRYFEGMQLVEVADACDVSLATIKRHLRKAEQRFVALARTKSELHDWLERSRWGAEA